MIRRRRVHPEGGGLSQLRPDGIARGYAGVRRELPPMDRAKFRIVWRRKGRR